MAGSKILDSANKGAFVGFFTNNGYSVSIYPALSIYKVKWSFFKTTGDKDAAFDIYMEIPTYISLMDSIMDRTANGLEARIHKEIEQKAQYPGAWKSGPMGEDGKNSIAIGASQKGGITLQGQTTKDGKKVNAFIPVPAFGDLRDLARISDAVLRLWKVDVTKGRHIDGISGWYEDRALIILKQMDSYRRETVTTEAPAPAPAPVQTTPAPAAEKPAAAKESVPAKEEKPAAKVFTPSPDGDGTFQLVVTSAMKENGPHKFLETYEDGDLAKAKVLLVFNKNSVEQLGERFSNLVARAENNRPFAVRIRGTKKGQQVLFLEFIKDKKN